MLDLGRINELVCTPPKKRAMEYFFYYLVDRSVVVLMNDYGIRKAISELYSMMLGGGRKDSDNDSHGSPNHVTFIDVTRYAFSPPPSYSVFQSQTLDELPSYLPTQWDWYVNDDDDNAYESRGA